MSGHDTDIGREAVAAAEDMAFGGTDLDDPMTRDELECRVGAVVATEWWRGTGPSIRVTRPRVSARSSSARACGDGVEVRLTDEQLTLATVAHELAHALAGADHGHDPRFRAAHVDVVALVAGAGAAGSLKAAYNAFELRIGPRRWAAPFRADGDGFRVVT